MPDKKIPQKFNYMKNSVVIVKLGDYQPNNIKNALKDLIDLLNLKTYFDNKSILLKPNALAPTKNAYTPPEIIEELIKILKNETSANEITLGDSSMTKKLTSITFNRTKMNRIGKQLGTRVINFFESERIKVRLNNPSHKIEEHIYLPKDISDTDIIINLPKLLLFKICWVTNFPL